MKPHFNPDNHDESECRQWCKVHWYYDFETGQHAPYGREFFFQIGPPVNGHKQWGRAWVHCGPPGFYPKRPLANEWAQIQMECPHEQADLTCNTCLRHTFRPHEMRGNEIR